MRLRCSWWRDAILRYQLLRGGVIPGHAGGGDGFAAFDSGGDLLVQEELGEQILRGAEAAGVEDGGVQRGMGVVKRIRAGQFERAIEGAIRWSFHQIPHKYYGLPDLPTVRGHAPGFQMLELRMVEDRGVDRLAGGRGGVLERAAESRDALVVLV